MKHKILFLVAFTLSAGFVSGAIRNVPSTYLTIQSALNASVAGDTVLVQPGTYYENITWPAVNSIVLLSAGDSSNSIIDGNAADRVITFNNGGIDTTTVIRGFKITNGRLTGSYAYGGGMYFNSASPKLVECSITANRLDSAAQWCYGAGIYCSYSSPVFRNCSVTNNVTISTSWAYGGGVHCVYSSSAKFYDCVISGNSITGNGWAYGAGIYMSQNSSVMLVNTIISGNHSNDLYRCYGGGLYAESGSSPALINVLITGNIMDGNAIWYNGGGADFSGSNTSPQLTNVTIADNVRSNGGTIDGSGIFASTGSVITVTNSVLWNQNTGAEVSVNSSTVNISYSCVRNGFTGTGNISTSPVFVSATDYHLQVTSPCINAGTLSGAPDFDLENNPRPQPALTNPDMGCYEINQVITGVPVVMSVLSTIGIYPNPVEDICTMFDLRSTIAGVEIYNAAGEQVFSQQPKAASQELVVDLSGLMSGVYFCRVICGSEEKTVKIIKQ
jgi:hypothetical protein